MVAIENIDNTESHSSPSRPNHNEELNQERYNLLLKGNSINPMIDAATPLLGLILRMKDMYTLKESQQLFKQVSTDIKAIEQTLQNEGYEPGVIVSFRYILCTFIDEIVMSRNWDVDNAWIQESLLVHFHNETWGGEKSFVLLDRLMGEPKRYRDLLEFIYLCFSLGFRGRYKLSESNSEEFNLLHRRLFKLINGMRGDFRFPLLHKENGNFKSRYKLKRKITIRHIFLMCIFVLLVVYLIYIFGLHTQTSHILDELQELLK